MLPLALLRDEELPCIGSEALLKLMTCSSNLHQDLDDDTCYEVALKTGVWHVIRPSGVARQAFHERWCAEQQFRHIRTLKSQQEDICKAISEASKKELLVHRCRVLAASVAFVVFALCTAWLASGEDRTDEVLPTIAFLQWIFRQGFLATQPQCGEPADTGFEIIRRYTSEVRLQRDLSWSSKPTVQEYFVKTCQLIPLLVLSLVCACIAACIPEIAVAAAGWSLMRVYHGAGQLVLDGATGHHLDLSIMSWTALCAAEASTVLALTVLCCSEPGLHQSHEDALQKVEVDHQEKILALKETWSPHTNVQRTKCV